MLVRNGDISLYVEGSTIPGSYGNFSVDPSTQDLQSRGLGSLISGALSGEKTIHILLIKFTFTC